MRDPYAVLGVARDATEDEIKAAYRELARKYHPDNYHDDNPLKELAKEKMQEINEAYDEIQKLRAKGSSSRGSGSGSYSSSGSVYVQIRQKIGERRYKEAEQMLMGVLESERVAEWHFLYSVCLIQRGRPNDAMRELEIACTMDPSNQEYQRAKEMFNQGNNRYGSAYYDNRGYRRSSNDDACNCCMNMICLDCLCECMGGDFISCI